jgi:hypothetical protein
MKRANPLNRMIRAWSFTEDIVFNHYAAGNPFASKRIAAGRNPVKPG